MLAALALFVGLDVYLVSFELVKPMWERPTSVLSVVPITSWAMIFVAFASAMVLAATGRGRLTAIVMLVASFVASLLVSAATAGLGFLYGPDVDSVWVASQSILFTGRVDLATSTRFQFPGWYILLTSSSLVWGVPVKTSQIVLFLGLLGILTLIIFLLVREMAARYFGQSLVLFLVPLQVVFALQAVPQAFAYILLLLCFILLTKHRTVRGTVLILILTLCMSVSHPLTPILLAGFIAAYVAVPEARDRSSRLNVLLMVATITFGWYVFVATLVLANIGRGFVSAFGVTIQRGVENATEARQSILTPNLSNNLNLLAFGFLLYMGLIVVLGASSFLRRKAAAPRLYKRTAITILEVAVPLLLVDLAGNRVADRIALLGILLTIPLGIFGLEIIETPNQGGLRPPATPTAKLRAIAVVTALCVGGAVVPLALAQVNTQFVTPADVSAYGFVSDHWNGELLGVSGLASGFLQASHVPYVPISGVASSPQEARLPSSLLVDSYLFENSPGVRDLAMVGNYSDYSVVYDSGNAQLAMKLGS